ncbi:MAG: hypothetical protein LBB88_10075 [Planctomycetaceae bacterium]|nr:hypothetical protein [Planctomycetaceae bacterium]
MSNPFYRCLRQRDLSAKGCEPTVAYLRLPTRSGVAAFIESLIPDLS